MFVPFENWTLDTIKQRQGEMADVWGKSIASSQKGGQTYCLSTFLTRCYIAALRYEIPSKTLLL